MTAPVLNDRQRAYLQAIVDTEQAVDAEIRALGLEYVVGKIDSTTRAGYFPGAARSP